MTTRLPTDTLDIRYFNGLHAVIILEQRASNDVLCRALYPKTDQMPSEDFIVHRDALEDKLRYPRLGA